jgi:hypothetical protein
VLLSVLMIYFLSQFVNHQCYIHGLILGSAVSIPALSDHLSFRVYHRAVPSIMHVVATTVEQVHVVVEMRTFDRYSLWQDAVLFVCF